MRSAVSDLIAINDRIRAGTIFVNFEGRNAPEDLYCNLERFGFACSDVMILSICPDGDDTVIGDLMTRDGRFYSFDFDLVDPADSRLERVQTAIGKARRYSEDVAEAAARWFKDL